MVGMAPVEVVSKAVQMLVNNVNSGSCIDRLLQEHVSYFHHNTMWVSCVRFILNSKKYTQFRRSVKMSEKYIWYLTS